MYHTTVVHNDGYTVTRTYTSTYGHLGMRIPTIVN